MLSAIVIVLSAVLICVIFIFATKRVRRKERKKNVITILVLILVVLFMITGLLIRYDSQQKNRPESVDMLESLSLNMTKRDVELIKGMPNIMYDNNGVSVSVINEQSVEDDNLPTWVYLLDRQSLIIKYHHNRIYSIHKSLNGKLSERCFNRTYIGQDSGDLIKILDAPSAVTTTPDNLKTLYSYKRYNLFYELANNKIVACGIYNSNKGAREYTP